MNPQMYFMLQLLQMGYNPQQAMQYAQQMAQISGGAGGGAAGGGGGQQNPLAALLGGSGNPGSVSPLGGIMQLLASLGAVGATKAPYNMQMQAAQTAANPGAEMSRINQFTRPMSQNLINSVTRAISPSIAERGLATSPGMSQQITAEALAPYELQEQQIGQSAALQSQQVPFQIGSGLAGQYPAGLSDLGTLFNQIQQASY